MLDLNIKMVLWLAVEDYRSSNQYLYHHLQEKAPDVSKYKITCQKPEYPATKADIIAAVDLDSAENAN